MDLEVVGSKNNLPEIHVLTPHVNALEMPWVIKYVHALIGYCSAKTSQLEV
jgi:hypothetical protein